MVSTFPALVLLLVVVIPGAIATFGYERHVGPVGQEGTDRLFRYIFGTALLAPTSLFVVWIVWANLLNAGATATAEGTNRIAASDDLPLGWFLLPIPYMLVPWIAGSNVGKLQVARYKKRLNASGSKAAERSAIPTRVAGWDFLFLTDGPRLVAVRLKDGTWIAGLFGSSSFASPMASTEKELVLEQRVEVGDDGQIPIDELGVPTNMQGSVRIEASGADLIVVTPT